MATTKKSSTSKTARVMNLLSKNREDAPEVESVVEEQIEQSAAAVQESVAPVTAAPAVAPAPHPSTPPLISSMQADSAISDQVLSALENALENEFGSADAVKEELSDAPVDIPATEIAEEADVVETSEPSAFDPVPEFVAAQESAPEPAAAIEDAPEEEDDQPHPPTRFPVDAATIYVNVMETLVEDKAMKYINLFGLCKCPRCVADVKALALNRLEPKYVVMRTGEVIPRITLYESQFAANVTSQLLTACKVVMQSPRHDRM